MKDDLKLTLDGIRLPNGRFMFYIPYEYEVELIQDQVVLVEKNDIQVCAKSKEEM